MGRFATGVALGIAATLLVAVAVWLGIAYGGLYDVAASRAHGDPVRWTLDTTLHRSVARQAADMRLPDSLPPDRLAEGARFYAETCAQCHGAPGREPARWSRGMRPEPPHLADAATDWSAPEIRWIVGNGLRMTGMPAFGDSHDAATLDAVAGFVTRLPGLSADDYAQLTGRGAAGAPAAPGD